MPNYPAKPTRIVSDHEILSGTPVVEGTRIPASIILAEIHAGTNEETILKHYPSLPSDGIDACLHWEHTLQLSIISIP